MAGMNGGLGFSPGGMSEGGAMQLKPHGIGVSALCPSYVRTRIAWNPGWSRRSSPRGSLPPSGTTNSYVFTHPDMRGEVEERFASILAAMDKVPAG